VVDPLPAGKTMLSLSANVSGSVNWNNLLVIGNGHVVQPSGSVTIIDSTVTGLGTPASDGIHGTATSLDIEGWVRSRCREPDLTVRRSATTSFGRTSADVRIVEPDAAPILTLSGKTAPTKLFQGNRLGAGRLIFDNTNHWLIGGDGDAQSNILIGPRATINLTGGTSSVIVRGNYDHHNYRGGWSQGFNLVSSQAGSGILVEHNLFRGSSWPIQDVTGEFRYPDLRVWPYLAAQRATTVR
jgi:hypothetical protein